MNRIQIHQGDCLTVLRTLPDESVHCCVTDPPYHLTTGKKGGSGPASVNLDSPYGRARITTGFMGKAWDGGDVAHRPETWAAVLRVVKPGGHLLAFGGTRTFHRLACAIEDAGWEIRDTIMWVYGSGFPKSLDVSKAIDKAAGVPATDAAKQWQGWGTALKPAWEPIIVARKPLDVTVAENVQQHGTGALNIDRCRVGLPEDKRAAGTRSYKAGRLAGGLNGEGELHQAPHDGLGRWPANLIHDGSPEVLAGFPQTHSGELVTRSKAQGWSGSAGKEQWMGQSGDSGSAARFFYCAKASRSERGEGNKHPTVKPLALMSYLVRLVCPPGGTVLDPFAGSGTTGRAAIEHGFKAVLIDLDAENIEITNQRTNVTPGLPI